MQRLILPQMARVLAVDAFDAAIGSLVHRNAAAMRGPDCGAGLFPYPNHHLDARRA
jgi:hypothetical protein